MHTSATTLDITSTSAYCTVLLYHRHEQPILMYKKSECDCTDIQTRMLRLLSVHDIHLYQTNMAVTQQSKGCYSKGRYLETFGSGKCDLESGRELGIG